MSNEIGSLATEYIFLLQFKTILGLQIKTRVMLVQLAHKLPDVVHQRVQIEGQVLLLLIDGLKPAAELLATLQALSELGAG